MALTQAKVHTNQLLLWYTNILGTYVGWEFLMIVLKTACFYDSYYADEVVFVII